MPDNKESKSQAGYEQLEQRVRASLESADAYTVRNQKLNSTLVIITIVGSALTAFLTGLTAATGPVPMPGILDWRGACSLGSVLSVVTAVSSGISQQLNISKRLMDGSQCVGRLRALELVIVTQSRAVNEVANEYADILRAYADVTK